MEHCGQYSYSRKSLEEELALGYLSQINDLGTITGIPYVLLCEYTLIRFAALQYKN